MTEEQFKAAGSRLVELVRRADFARAVGAHQVATEILKEARALAYEMAREAR